MEIVPTNYTVADYCQAMARNEILVNRDYQRSHKVWPLPARSFLIETILLGFPMPKLSLFQKLDVKSKKTYKEIVDGQQRSRSILDFYKNDLILSKTIDTSELAGCTYSSLPDEYQERFLNYSLSADVFVGATPETIREVFRRINSYTVPLNPEEGRHATFQGQFKWFIYGMTRKWDGMFSRMGLFGENQFARMADAKLLTEISHAFENSISTTNKLNLEELYRQFDKTFPGQSALVKRFDNALKRLDEWEDIHNTVLTKPFVVYSLLLAISHIQEPCKKLQNSWPLKKKRVINKSDAIANLLLLADALEDEDYENGPYQEFVEACRSKTNVSSQREARFKWFCKALLNRLEQ